MQEQGIHNVQAKLDLLSGRQRLNICRILKSQGIRFDKDPSETTNGESFKFEVSDSMLSRIENVLHRYLNKDQQQEEKIFFSTVKADTTPAASSTPIAPAASTAPAASSSCVGGVTDGSKSDSNPNPKRSGRRVVIMETNGSADAEVITVNQDIDELERQMKQNVTLKPSQLRTKRKIKDLLKKIAKHRHTCTEKNYGQEIHDRDDDGDASEDPSIMIEDADPIEDETIPETVIEEDSNEIEDDSDEENMSNISNIIYDEDEESKPNEDTSDGDGDTDDPVTDVDDEASVSETGETSLDDEIIENMVANVDEEEVEESVKDSDRIDFKGMSMHARFDLYKEILQRTKSIDFGDISNLGLQ